jgi:hypothetical protein
MMTRKTRKLYQSVNKAKQAQAARAEQLSSRAETLRRSARR